MKGFNRSPDDSVSPDGLERQLGSGGSYRHRLRSTRRKKRAARQKSLIAGLLVITILGVAYTFTRPTKPVAVVKIFNGQQGVDKNHGNSTTSSSAGLLTTAQWRIAWGSAMAWGYGTASNTTVRELATVGIGGSAVRVRISNLFGSGPLVIGAANVAKQTHDSSVDPTSVLALTFSGSPGITIQTGQIAYSDPVNMSVVAQEVLAVSLFVSNSDLVTVHPCCSGPNVSYYTGNGGGNVASVASGSVFTYASPWPRWVDAVDVLQQPQTSPQEGSIVVVGDSISEGFNANVRWTDVLQKRVDMLASNEQRAIINEGITANTLTDLSDDYSKVGGGPAGLDRIARDALDQSGVSEIILLLGTNDLYFGATDARVIAGLQQAIALVHQSGLKIIGVTLLPRMAAKEPWDPTEQQYLQNINQWILNSGSFDGVLDFASVIADDYNSACIPSSIFPPYNSGDNLHPSAAGQTAMADSIVGPEIGLPKLPYVPELVNVTPTKGCAGAPGIPGPVPMPPQARAPS